MTPYTISYFLKSLSTAMIVRRSLFARLATSGSFAPCPIISFDNLADGTSATILPASGSVTDSSSNRRSFVDATGQLQKHLREIERVVNLFRSQVGIAP